MFSRFDGELLRRARLAVGMSREELAVATATTYPAIMAWETNYRNPGLPTLLRLADALGVRVEDFLTREEALAP